MLKDNSFYKKLPFNPTKNFKSEIDALLTLGLAHKWLNKHEFKYLSN